MVHHAAGLAGLIKDTRGADFCDRLREDHGSAPLTDRERALVAYGIKLTRDPAGMTEGDLAPMRAAGLSDAEILHANLVVGYFAFANRLTNGLGIELEPEHG